MLVVIFRSKLRAEYAEEYRSWAERIDALANTMPGFLGIQSYANTSGERVSISYFENDKDLLAWREHPEHLAVQQLGREKFYESYSVEVCRLERAYDFPLASDMP